ncbi:Phosphatidylserine decarboxylase proenzyme [Aquicella siphonis]|uniref:Phosphatidylserine decarboxylase proenzyme n=1 Tax=Aquicella siphonis TaxID=254247 RepID=A0A5E4PJZ5_9COXI|nr:archaetidylserine decarboxylase [Aquicella siphonis]VVC76808.1 Phosphatidylserine decarboxylase proenzyme [Aquicella siphonis]
MTKRISVYIQYLLPHHLITAIMGWLARIRIEWLKNWMIKRFIRKYQVDMTTALIENPDAYPDFNSFFTRRLKPELRPIAARSGEIACPVDGCIAQIGQIHKNQLLQAKGFYFDLETLLGEDSRLASAFYDGTFATLYLAPRDYHRVHSPFSGRLVQSIYLPGKLFSVNRMTSELIPQLYSRNERLVMLFDTAAGPMALIMVGAMIVGNIQTVWMNQPVRTRHRQIVSPSSEIQFQTGDELGHFKLGSTVILLFGKNRVAWEPLLHPHSTVLFGQLLGNMLR